MPCALPSSYPGLLPRIDIGETEAVADAEDVCPAVRVHALILPSPGAKCAPRVQRGQRHLDQLPPAARTREHLIERRAGRDALILPAVREGELLEPHGVRRVEGAVEIGRIGGGCRDLEPVEDRAAAVVADDDLQPGLGLVGRQQQRADVVQEGEIAEQHAGDPRGAARLAGEGDAGGGGDRAVDAGESAVRVHRHLLAAEHRVGHAHESRRAEHQPVVRPGRAPDGVDEQRAIEGTSHRVELGLDGIPPGREVASTRDRPDRGRAR